MLPRLDKPRILEIGCGSGIVTLELARLSGGDIVALDKDRNALDRLVSRAGKDNLSDRITVVCTTMQKMDFPHGSFNIIWSEGAISFIGFERGLSEWRDLLAPNGYLVVHDVLSDLNSKVKSTLDCGYSVVGQFILTPEIWWKKYYMPLKRRLVALPETKLRDRKTLEEIKAVEREIKEFDLRNDQFGSVFFILRRA